MRDPLEVSFVYPSPDRPKLDIGARLALSASILTTQVILLIVGIMTGISILKRQHWAWFVGVGMYALAAIVYAIALALLPPYTTNDRVYTMAISLTSLYLLSRKDVRQYLERPPTA